jgi:ferritin-like protein
MYCNVTPLTEEPDDIVHRLQIAHDEEWVSKFPYTQRNMLLDAIREIRGLRSGQDAMMQDAKVWDERYRALMADRDDLRRRLDAIHRAKEVQP